MMSQYSRAFRRKVLDLLETGPQKIRVPDNLGLSQQAVCNYRKQDVRALQRGRALLEEVPDPKGFTRPSTR